MVFGSICEHCVYFCVHKQLSNFSCEQRALSKIQMASIELFRKIHRDGEQRALGKFSASQNLSFIDRIHCFAPRNRLLSGSHLQNRTVGGKLGWFNQFQHLAANCALGLFGQAMVKSHCYGHCYVKKLKPLWTFLKFHTHLEEN